MIIRRYKTEAKLVKLPAGQAWDVSSIDDPDVVKSDEINDETNKFFSKLNELMKEYGLKAEKKISSATFKMNITGNGKDIEIYGWHGKEPKYGNTWILHSVGFEDLYMTPGYRSHDQEMPTLISVKKDKIFVDLMIRSEFETYKDYLVSAISAIERYLKRA